MKHTCACIHSHTHTHIKHQTLREARNSIPRATWKLKEMRSSRNSSELESDLGSRGRKRGGHEDVTKQSDYAQTQENVR